MLAEVTGAKIQSVKGLGCGHENTFLGWAKADSSLSGKLGELPVPPVAFLGVDDGKR